MNIIFMRDKPLKLDAYIRLLYVCWISKAERRKSKITWLSKPYTGILHNAPKSSNVFQVQSAT